MADDDRILFPVVDDVVGDLEDLVWPSAPARAPPQLPRSAPSTTAPSVFGAAIFILNASRRLQADRFYTDCFNEEVYTWEGLRWIDRTDFKTVILRHFPELADTGLANIKNAFEPWDVEPKLSPERHPLRTSDAELKHDPWRGDAYCRG